MKKKSISVLFIIVMFIGLGGLAYKLVESDHDKENDEDTVEVIEGSVTDDQEEVVVEEKKHEHKEGKIKKENEVKATCTSPGGYDEVIYCTDKKCKEELSRNHVDVDPLPHSYNKGKCKVCGAIDPDFAYSSYDIVSSLNNHVVASDGGYKAHLGADQVSIFSEEKSNAISIQTLAWYNLWGHNEQSVTFNCKELASMCNTLYYTVGGETGSEKNMNVAIYINGNEESGTLVDNYTINCTDLPVKKSIDISNASSLYIHVSGDNNTIVFCDFSSKTY